MSFLVLLFTDLIIWDDKKLSWNTPKVTQKMFFILMNC